MTRIAKICIAAIAAVLFSAPLSAIAEDQIAFDHPGAELTGKLLGSYVMVGSGPMLNGSILYLDAPIAIAGNKESSDGRNRRSVKNVGQILLTFEGPEPSDDLFGGIIRVTGRLINKPSDPFHTRVTMIVTDTALLTAAENGQPVASFKTH